MALQRRFQTPIDPTEDPAYQPGAMKPGIVRRGGATGTAERVPVPSSEIGMIDTPPAPNPTPESGPYTPVDTASWNTDGYQAPRYTPQSVGRTALGGYESSKLGSNTHQTPKYAVGRIVSNYEDTPDGLRQALPDLQRAYPGVQLIGTNGDKLDFRNTDWKELGVIDIGMSFSTGGRQGFQWLPDESGMEPYTPMQMPTQAQPPTERNAILEMLEADGKKPLRTARYRVPEV